LAAASPGGGGRVEPCASRTASLYAVGMPEGRSDIPRELERALFVEAGHRCAIPTCRAVAPLVIEHIDDWATVREHTFENMIVLCANCHGLKGEGPRKLDRKALRQYKINLGIINNRYSDFERRVLEYFTEEDRWHLVLPADLDILVLYLIKDGLLVKVPREKGTWYDEKLTQQGYVLTPAGREFVKNLAAAQPVSSEANQ
jgi:HNH endonuclease